jgi:hypothetical protein
LQARPARSVLPQLELHVAGRARPVVSHLHLQRHDHARGRHAADRLEPDDREVDRVGRRLGGAVHQPDRRAGLRQLPDRGGGLFVGPVAEPEVARQPERAAARTRLGGDGRGAVDRGPRPGCEPRPPRAADRLADARDRIRPQRLPRHDPRTAVLGGGDLGKQANRQIVAAGGGVGRDPLGHAAAAVECRRGVARAGPVVHRQAVVEQHQVETAATEQAAEGRPPAGLGQSQDDPGHGGRPQGEQEQLPEQDPRLVLLLARDEQFHRRPANPPVPQQIDQVDEHRRRHQRQPPPHQRREIEGGHGGSGMR